MQSLIFRRCWYIIRTRVRKEMRNWCVLVNLLGYRKRASVWCMTQEAIVTDCSHLLELRLANPRFFPLSSFFHLVFFSHFPTTLPSSDRDLRPILFAQPFPPWFWVVVELRSMFYWPSPTSFAGIPRSFHCPPRFSLLWFQLRANQEILRF